MGATEQNEVLFRVAMRRIFRRLTGKVLVDLGSGDGKYSLELAKIMKAKQLICVDHEVALVDQAKKMGVGGVNADLNLPLPFKDNLADVVSANQVIEHVAKTDVLMREMYRILKPGGTMVLCTPNLASWHNIGALMFGYQPFSSQVSDEAFLGNPWHPKYQNKIGEVQAHLRVFTQRSLGDLAMWHGFVEIRAEGVGYYPLGGKWADWMGKLDGRHSAYILFRGKKR